MLDLFGRKRRLFAKVNQILSGETTPKEGEVEKLLKELWALQKDGKAHELWVRLKKKA